MSVGVIAAIVVGTFIVGAAIDSKSNYFFKKDQHAKMNDPSKQDN